MKKYLKALGVIFLCLAVIVTALVITDTVRAQRSKVAVEQTALSDSAAQEQIAAQKEMNGLGEVVLAMCNNIYPKPTFAECVDKAKHGVGSGFDPHSGFLNAKEEKEFTMSMKGIFAGVGIEVMKPSQDSYVFVVDVIEGTPADKVGMMSGDSISKIGDVSTRSLKKMEDIIDLIKGKPGTSVSVEVERKGLVKPLKLTLVREEFKVVQISGTLLYSGTKTYAVIVARKFNDGFAKEMKEKFIALKREAKSKGTSLSGLVITVEDNPGGILHEVHNAVDLFLDAESIVLTRSNDGISVYRPEKNQIMHTPGDITNGLPMLVITNGGSASASEIFSGALKHYGRAVIAGSTSFGKGTAQDTIPLSYGGLLKMTSAEYLIGSIEDWQPTQCIGVTPDINFTYPGSTLRKSIRECELVGVINSGGLMMGGPVHRPIKETNPEMYKEAESMLSTYITYRMPEMKKKETIRQMLEAAE